MTAEEWSGVLTATFYGASVLSVFIFILLYQVLAKWEETSLGRHIMAFSLATFAVLFQGVMGYLQPGYDGQLVLRPLVFFLFLIVWVWRIVIFLTEQSRNNSEGFTTQLKGALRKLMRK